MRNALSLSPLWKYCVSDVANNATKGFSQAMKMHEHTYFNHKRKP